MVILRDRTRELHQIFDSIRSQRGISSSGSNAGVYGGGAPSLALASSHEQQQQQQLGERHSRPTTAEAQRFSAFAQEFSKELAGVSETIGNLTRLIQQQSVFDDQAGEISSLTSIVKTKLAQLHDDLNVLCDLREEAEAQHRSAFSTRRTQSDAHSSTVVDSLRSKLVHMSQNFKSALQQRTRTIKDAAHRRSRFTSDRPTSFESALFQHEESGEAGGAAAQGGPSAALALAPSNTQYFRQRHEAVRQIEAAVNEVGEMFQDFTRLVHEQEEMVLRIDADVDDAVRFVDDGSSELLRYLSNLSSNRGLILKIFGILFFFLLFFGFVVVR